MRQLSTLVILCLVAGAPPVLAQSASSPSENITVSSLLAQDYAIVGTVAVPSGGGGLYMRKANKLYFCFVTETPQSATLSTRYCKAVD